jgi:hypothetical protein
VEAKEKLRFLVFSASAVVDAKGTKAPVKTLFGAHEFPLEREQSVAGNCCYDRIAVGLSESGRMAGSFLFEADADLVEPVSMELIVLREPAREVSQWTATRLRFAPAASK